ncbi:EPM2A-interacting protein 1-like [Tiliqua scincoides]|uniref:EPM2A-interacting protein 1-like n=1 Tax=Tiliqua scincoides TaxID=71010 RepID=UPI003461F9CB
MYFGLCLYAFSWPRGMDRKRRKVDNEGRLFNPEWGTKYFFTHCNEKALYLICKENVAVLKEYNLRRHYETKRERTYSQYIGAQRSEKLEQLKRNLESQRAVFAHRRTENEAVTKASYKVTCRLSRRGKSFTDAELIKGCAMDTVEEITPVMKVFSTW